MDTPFAVTRWQPTRPLRQGEATRSPDEIKLLSVQLAEQTKTIQHRPYDPESWLLRAETLRKLRYPELAFGDAHKASMLCAQHLREVADDRDKQWRLGSQMGFWMLEMRPENDGSKDRLLGLQKKAHRSMEKHLSSPKEDGVGKFCPRPYPWLTPGRASRSDALVKQFDQELTASACDVLCETSSSCEVRRHAFGQHVPESRDVLGVFATRDLTKGSTILVDKSRIWGCNGPGKDGDLENLHGGNGCGDPMHPNIPDEDTSLDLRWVRDIAGKDASTALLGCRLLLTAIQDGVANPLDHHLAARLTPTYRYVEDATQSFHRDSDFDIPLRALQQFGIDIFANHNFDTWVLLTLAARVENNCCGDVISESLMPLFSLFNHSCEPNVGWIRPRYSPSSSNTSANDNDPDEAETWFGELPSERGVDHATVVVTALRDIQKGEQLFVEYDSFVHGVKVAERRERLKKWLPAGCVCARCVREAAEEQQADGNGKVDEKMGYGEGDWDDSGLVILPEDRL